MENNLRIRNATLKDYQSLCAIFAQANTEHCQMRPDLYRKVDTAVSKTKFNLAVIARDTFGYQPVSLQVAEREGRVVGAVYVESLARSALSWSAFEKEAYLDNVVVMPNERQQGIGSALLQAAQDWSKSTGHTRLWGKILTKNAASLALFKKAGFETDSMNVGLRLG